MSDDRVTTGEIYRICQRIEEQVTLQNSRIRKLEDAHLRIKTFWTIGAIVGGLGLDWLKHRLGF